MRRGGLILLALVVIVSAAVAQLVDIPDGARLRELVAQAGTAASAGFTAGAMIAFGIARRLGRDALAPWLGERLHTIEEVFTTRGVEATLVLRLLPIVPFTLANFGAGVTAVKAHHFALGTALGLVPSTVLAAVLGDALSDLGSPRSVVALAVWVVLAAVGLLWGRALLRAGTQKAVPAGDRDGLKRL